MGQKIAFGLGMLANQMFPAMIGIFTVVLVEKLGFSGLLLGLTYFIPKFYDALFDLIMGYVSDNTKSKWGRRRQYVLAGAIILGISFALMWQLYVENGVTYNFWYFLVISLIFYSGLTIFSIPYVAMGYEMSDDFHERTNIMATSQLIGQLAWVVAPWFWVLMADKSLFSSSDVAVRTLSVYVAVGCTILAAIPAFFIPSKSTLNENYSPIDFKGILGSFGEIKEGLKASIEIKPFRKICIATFLIFNAFQTTAGFSYFIIKYYLFKGNEEGFGLWPTLFGCVGAIITTIVVIPIVAKMSKVMGKKKAFLLSQGISIIGYILLFLLFVPGKPYLFLFALPFFSFGIGSLFTLMMSMTSDVIDIDELNTGKRREGSLGAIYWWMVKFGTAVAGLLSGIILSLVSFQSNAATQTDETMFWLRIFFVGIPILGTLTAIWAMKDYDIDEAKALEVRDLIDKRKAQGKKQSSAYLSGKLLSLGKNGSAINSISGIDLSSKSETEIREQFSEILNSGLHGLCFSPYVEGQKAGDILSESQINKRLDIISPYTQWIRTFSCSEGNELIPEIARLKGLKTVVGAWISDDKERNEREINSLIALANAGLVNIAAIGNEVLHRGEIAEQELLQYIKRVRQALPVSIPVGYVDAYYQFLDRPALVDACDVILANCYPFWEGADNQYAISYLDQMIELTQGVAKGKKVIITETGWPSTGEPVEAAKPSNVNAMNYFIAVQEWAKNKNIELFYFSSFDESWKINQEGEVGTAWGIWDKNEKLKFDTKIRTNVI
ncbi:MFS transporter [Flavobacterium luteum]|uniref:Endo-1,3-beta-glucanase btgC n=2 Tax=Flavobacterium luteum TaxID=2026654 RepID=A0A7J5ABG2_9FLAO|nr:MFS transporter [Flavobacterium luteum]